jgi:HK97 family phage major capsid protein
MPAVLDRLHDERRQLLEMVDRITDSAEADERDLSDSDRELISRHHARIDEIDPQIEQLEAIEVQRAQHVDRLPVPVRRAPADVPPEPAAGDVYRTYAQWARDQLVVRYDAVAQLAGGAPARAAAEERISRVMAHTLSSDVPGLLPAQYLSTFAETIGAQRPIVSASRSVALTNGKLSYPSITQRPQVGKQAAQKTEAPSRTMLVDFVDVIADTYVGAGNLSWQAINWSTPDALTLWFDLAAEEYARQTESAAGTTLAALVAGTPVMTNDLAGWIGAIATAAGAVYSGSHRMADTIFADVGRGYSIISMVSAQSPVFLPGGSFSLGSGQGTIAGLRLVVSYGLPADTVVVGVASQLLTAETAGAPVELRAVEPAIGGMEVGVIGAFAAKIVEAAAFNKLGAPA